MENKMISIKEQTKERLYQMKELRVQEITMIALVLWGLYSWIFTKHPIDGSKLFELLIFQTVMLIFFIKRKSSSEMTTVLFLMTPYIYKKLEGGEYLSLVVIYLIFGFLFYYWVKKKKIDYKKSYIVFLTVYGFIACWETLINKVGLEREGFVDDYYFMVMSGFSSLTLIFWFLVIMIIVKKIKK